MDLYASSKAQGKKCTNCLGIITDQHKCLKDKLLIYESNGNKVLCLPIVQPSVNSWKDPVFKVALLLIILQSMNSMMGNLQQWSSIPSAAYSLLSRSSETQAEFIRFESKVRKLTPYYTALLRKNLAANRLRNFLSLIEAPSGYS